MLIVGKLHAGVLAFGQNEVAVGAGHSRRRARMFEPGIDLVDRVQDESHILKSDAQSFLISRGPRRIVLF